MVSGDLGVVARRAAPPVPAKITSSMPLGAHGLGGVGAHHPAQGFQQVGLAAAVRPDDAGQARLDPELGRIDEGLEAREAEPLEVHGARAPSGPYFEQRLDRGVELRPATARRSSCLPLMTKVGVPLILSLAGLVSTRVVAGPSSGFSSAMQAVNCSLGHARPTGRCANSRPRQSPVCEHLVLAVEDGVDARRSTCPGRRSGRSGSRRRRPAAGGGQELAEHVAHLAGVDVLGLEGREDLVVASAAQCGQVTEAYSITVTLARRPCPGSCRRRSRRWPPPPPPGRRRRGRGRRGDHESAASDSEHAGVSGEVQSLT